MGRLTDPLHGLCAQRALGPLHPAVRAERMEHELAALRRTMVRDVRTRHAFKLNQPPDGEAETIVTPSPDGYYRLTSDDGSITWTQGTDADPHQIDGSASGGCDVAIKTIHADDRSHTYDEGCDNTLGVHGEDQCGSGPMRANLALGGAHPEINVGILLDECTSVGVLAGYGRIPADLGEGEQCYAVPLYECAGGPGGGG